MATFESIAAETGVTVAEIFTKYDLHDQDPTATLRPDIADGLRKSLLATNLDAKA